MNDFAMILQNKILVTALIGWACSQILKPFTFMIVNKRFDASRLTGDGGMPWRQGSPAAGIPPLSPS